MDLCPMAATGRTRTRLKEKGKKKRNKGERRTNFILQQCCAHLHLLQCSVQMGSELSVLLRDEGFLQHQPRQPSGAMALVPTQPFPKLVTKPRHHGGISLHQDEEGGHRHRCPPCGVAQSPAATAVIPCPPPSTASPSQQGGPSGPNLADSRSEKQRSGFGWTPDCLKPSIRCRVSP